ncbi:MAG: beta-lactamase family protein [Bacteroidetes bacterium]|nr:beta-lactamase family protein [Bacteroidota bacterium]
MIDSILLDYNKPDSPGAAVMIIQNGKILFEHGYGLANLEDKIPVQSNTNFRLASVTKEFTAAAIMLLIKEGKLNFGEKLTEIFPGFPAYGRNISIKNLLNHTSGLIDYENLIPDTATVQVKDKDVLEIMMKQDSTYFEPGTKYQYSNTAYALLSQIVEKISGKPFAEFLKENIFDPLKMENTVAYEKGISEVKNRAYGYSKKDSVFIRTDQSLTSAVLGDGGIYTSIDDMYKWDQSLYTEKILPKEFIKESFTRGTLKNVEKIDYGFGWHLKTYKGHEIVYHTGSTIGFRNVIYRIPELKFTVILLTNRDEGDTEKIAEEICDVYLGDKWK